jgi:hypothetical protein
LAVLGKRQPQWLNLHTVHAALEKALKACKLPETLTMYSCSRHTYAAHFVLGGGSLSALRELLGHSSVTDDRALRPPPVGHAPPGGAPTLPIDMSRPGGAVLEMAAHRA